MGRLTSFTFFILLGFFIIPFSHADDICRESSEACWDRDYRSCTNHPALGTPGCVRHRESTMKRMEDGGDLEQGWFESNATFTARKNQVEAYYNECLRDSDRNCKRRANRKAKIRDDKLQEEAAERYGMAPTHAARDKLREEEQSRRSQEALLEASRQTKLARAEKERKSAHQWSQQMENEFEEVLSDSTMHVSDLVGKDCIKMADIAAVAEKLSEDVFDAMSYYCEKSPELKAGFEATLDWLRVMENDLTELGYSPREMFEKGAHGKSLALGLYGPGVGLSHPKNIEAVVHGKDGEQSCMGVFCVAGQSAAIKASAGKAEINAAQTIGCPNNDSYKGAFFSVDLGIEVAAGVGLSYSFGLDIHGFIDHMVTNISGERTEADVDRDIQQMKNYFMQSGDQPIITRLSLLIFLKMVSKVHKIDPQMQAFVDEQLKNADYVEELKKLTGPAGPMSANIPSLGQMLKNNLGGLAAVEGLPTWLKRSMTNVDKLFTGCDSLTLGASIGASVGGGLGFGLSEYTMAGEIPMRELENLAAGFALPPSSIAAAACADPQGFKRSARIVYDRLKEIATNIPKCQEAAKEGLACYNKHMLGGNTEGLENFIENVASSTEKFYQENVAAPIPGVGDMQTQMVGKAVRSFNVTADCKTATPENEWKSDYIRNFDQTHEKCNCSEPKRAPASAGGTCSAEANVEAEIQQ